MSNSKELFSKFVDTYSKIKINADRDGNKKRSTFC